MSYCAHCGAEVGWEAATCAACGKPPRSHPRVASGQRDRTLLTMLLLAAAAAAVVCAGLFAAVVAPHLLDARQKARQKRTVIDMRTVGTAWAAWLTDEISAAAAGASTAYDFTALEQALTAAELERQLRRRADSSVWVDDVPDLDGWGHSLEFRQASNLLARRVMAIRSPGRDGVFSGGSYRVGVFAEREYDEDIVWADGYFVRAPRGVGPVAGTGR